MHQLSYALAAAHNAWSASAPLKSILHLQDTTFEMERQRNKPVKYNRELVHKSVKAMQKVEEVCFQDCSNSFCLCYVPFSLLSVQDLSAVHMQC